MLTIMMNDFLIEKAKECTLGHLSYIYHPDLPKNAALFAGVNLEVKCATVLPNVNFLYKNQISLWTIWEHWNKD